MGIPIVAINRVVVVGLGGIGSAHVFELARKMSRYKGWPRELLLVDGDIYTEGNLDRQQVLASDVGQNKARCWAKALASEYGNLQIGAITAYVGQKNIVELSLEGTAVLLGVDNHPTRKLFSKYMEENHREFVLICGGNERTDGSVITYLRKAGEDMTPALTVWHPEIENPKGKNPADLSCAELAKMEGGEQIMDANASAARIMMHMLRLVIEGDKEPTDFKAGKIPDHIECNGCGKPILEGSTTNAEGKPICALCNVKGQADVYFDIQRNTVRPRARFVPGKEIEVKRKEEVETPKRKEKGAKDKGIKAPRAKKPRVAKVLVGAPEAPERRGIDVIPPAPEVVVAAPDEVRDQTIGGPAKVEPKAAEQEPK